MKFKAQQAKNDASHNIQSVSISKWTLRLSKQAMQNELTTYFRREVQSNAKVIVPIMLIASLATFLLSMVRSSQQELHQTWLIMGTSSMAVSIVLLCSFKKIALIELLFPAFYLMTTICILVVQFGHIFGEPTDLTRQQAVFMIIFIHCIFTLFLSATFSSGFLTRILIHIPFGTFVVAERRRHNADMNFA